MKLKINKFPYSIHIKPPYKMKGTVTKSATKDFDLFGNEIITDPLLRDRFIEPPFSVLDTKTAGWQNRKRLWIAKGIKSEVGRDGNLTFAQSAQSPGVYEFRNKIRAQREAKMKELELNEKKLNAEEKKQLATWRKDGCDPSWEELVKLADTEGVNLMGGTSIFDPALTELLYRWFCPDGGKIIDPFAGGSVRGVVANFLGYKYHGIELRPEQVEANRLNALEILPENNQPAWYCGDSDKELDNLDAFPNASFDFCIGCPPYFNLEVYSDMPEDLSNMDYDGFEDKYTSIIKKTAAKLKPGALAAFVVTEVRNKDEHGFYTNFVEDTKKAFRLGLCGFYNDAVLLNTIGSAAIRANRQFNAGQKLVRLHQNVLVFKKI